MIFKDWTKELKCFTTTTDNNNQQMEGVDLLDNFVAKHRTKVNGKKWW